MTTRSPTFAAAAPATSTLPIATSHPTRGTRSNPARPRRRSGEARLALLDKRRHRFAPVLCERHHRHHLGGVGVRVRLVEIDLRVERLLADALRVPAAAARRARQRLRLRDEIR